MSLPSSAPIDFATADEWLGFRPGMPRAEVRAAVGERGGEFPED